MNKNEILIKYRTQSSLTEFWIYIAGLLIQYGHATLAKEDDLFKKYYELGEKLGLNVRKLNV